MIWIFTCPTKDCENNINPVYLGDPVNPVECGLCHAFADSIETDEPLPTQDLPPMTKAKK